MIKEIIATARTVDAAIDSGCEKLGLSRDEIDFEIIDMPHKGFLGFSQTPAKVRVFKEEPDEEIIVSKTSSINNKSQIAQQYIADIIDAMKLNEITITSSNEENNITFNLEGDATRAVIGRRGETLDALQYLTGLAANRVEGDYLRVVLDSGNYRERRCIALEQLAKKLAAAVLKTGRNTTLEPMNPYERRIIHSTVSEIDGVSSSSIGEEPNRCVIISSNNPRPQQAGYEKRPRNGSSRGSRPSGRDGGYRGSRENGRKNDHRGPRRDKPAPYQESSKRDVAPAEAANKPLYGKIDL